MKDYSLSTIEKQQLKTGLQLLERQSFILNNSRGGGVVLHMHRPICNPSEFSQFTALNSTNIF